MKSTRVIPLLFCILLEASSTSVGPKIIKQNEGIKNIETLDDAGKVTMSWEVDEVNGSITFEIEAETLGYVGFGISPQGSMTGADIFIAGVGSDGVPYSSDRYGTGFTEPAIDTHSDWTLLEAREFHGITLNRTYLKFSRLLSTCDDQDYPITNGTNRLIWALGDTDEIKYHSSNRRGSRSVNLLGGPTPNVNLDEMKTWDSVLDMAMPEDNTAYWCSLHKGPILTEKHHIVAFDAILPDENALKHTHHFIIYNCYLPDDGSLDEAFENSTVDKGVVGDFCYRMDPSLPFVGLECQEYLYVWAKGGKKMVFPENVGYPIGEKDGGKQRYYKLEIHYDNPEGLKDVKFSTGVRVYYTNNTREHDAGQLMVGHDTTLATLVPPNISDFVVVGHCHPECTAKFPPGGLNVFNVLLHSHLSGRKLKIRHFRERTELPFLDYDDHYDFDYQQNKPLVQDVKILPGDQLAYECTYDSTWKNGEIVIGGLTTREEMCETFIWYYPKQDIDVCGSSYPLDLSLSDLGITNYTTFDDIGQSQFYIYEPETLQGFFQDSISHKYNWTEEAIAELRQKRRYEDHQAVCQSRKNYTAWERAVNYPVDFVEFVPDDICDPRVETPTAGGSTTTPVSTTVGGGGNNPSKGAKSFANYFMLATLVLFLVTNLSG